MTKSSLISLLISSFSHFSAIQDSLSTYAKEENIGIEQIKLSPDGSYLSVYYLGSVSFKDKGTCHILSVFQSIQMADVPIGVSDVVFLDENFHRVRAFRLDLKDELPIRLVNGSLEFRDQGKNEQESNVFRLKLGELFPETICVSPNVCY